ncbi:MAG: hypothetical protein J2P17_17400, partial [Mycobacterium sp.]|nr:hypothetical protein [Mycobacterium sp.]
MTRNVLRFLGTIGAASALVLAASACGSSSNNGGSGSGGGSANNKNLTLGFVGAQTGPDAQLGINISNGVQLAIAQHNAKSGVTKVKYKAYDTQG